MFELSYIWHQAHKLWDKHTILLGELNQNELFPLSIQFPALSSRSIVENFAQIRSSTQTLSNNSLKHNFQIVYKQINHRQLGIQHIPEQVVFQTRIDFLRFCAKLSEFKTFQQLVAEILKAQPALSAWLKQNPAKVLEYQDVWPGLLMVCQYFQEHPLPNKYLRELEIAKIDSKFIEQNKNILANLLSLLLPPASQRESAAPSKSIAFEWRFGLKYAEPLIRCRLLDPSIMQLNSNWLAAISDLSLPLSEFAKLNLPCQRVFISENKINGLSFPQVQGASIIFGLGYGIESLKNISWLKSREIWYWGDIDSHGFAMLSQLRSYFPQVKSMLMNLITFQACQAMWVSEPEHTRCTAQLNNLTTEEQTVYQTLLTNQLGLNLRLEQERINFKILADFLLKLTY